MLQVICAMYAMLYNRIKAAPIWDTEIQDFVGKASQTVYY